MKRERKRERKDKGENKGKKRKCRREMGRRRRAGLIVNFFAFGFFFSSFFSLSLFLFAFLFFLLLSIFLFYFLDLYSIFFPFWVALSRYQSTEFREMHFDPSLCREEGERSMMNSRRNSDMSVVSDRSSSAGHSPLRIVPRPISMRFNPPPLESLMMDNSESLVDDLLADYSENELESDLDPT